MFISSTWSLGCLRTSFRCFTRCVTIVCVKRVIQIVGLLVCSFMSRSRYKLARQTNLPEGFPLRYWSNYSRRKSVSKIYSGCCIIKDLLNVESIMRSIFMKSKSSHFIIYFLYYKWCLVYKLYMYCVVYTVHILYSICYIMYTIWYTQYCM